MKLNSGDVLVRSSELVKVPPSRMETNKVGEKNIAKQRLRKMKIGKELENTKSAFSLI